MAVAFLFESLLDLSATSSAMIEVLPEQIQCHSDVGKCCLQPGPPTGGKQQKVLQLLDISNSKFPSLVILGTRKPFPCKRYQVGFEDVIVADQIIFMDLAVKSKNMSKKCGKEKHVSCDHIISYSKQATTSCLPDLSHCMNFLSLAEKAEPSCHSTRTHAWNRQTSFDLGSCSRLGVCHDIWNHILVDLCHNLVDVLGLILGYKAKKMSMDHVKSNKR